MAASSLQTQQITRSAFRISFHPDWQIDNGFFNRPIMARTQILVHRWGAGNKDFIAIFIDMFAPKWARGPLNLACFPS